MNELISQFQRFVRVWLRIGKNRLKLFKVEFKIATSTIRPLLVLMVLVVMSLFSIWALFLILIGFGIFALTANILISIASVLLINIALLMLMFQIIRFLLNMASFQKTRKNFGKTNIKESNT